MNLKKQMRQRGALGRRTHDVKVWNRVASALEARTYDADKALGREYGHPILSKKEWEATMSRRITEARNSAAKAQAECDILRKRLGIYGETA